MTKLTNIIRELEVSKPLNKKEVVEFILKDEDGDMHDYIFSFDSLEIFLDFYGFEDVATLFSPKLLEYIKFYYRNFQPGEVKVVNIEEAAQLENINISKYKTLTILGINEDNAQTILLHNLGPLNL